MKVPTHAGVMVVPGLYDVDGQLHFYPEEYCAGQGIPVNDHNLALVEQVMVEETRRRYPGVPVFDVYTDGVKKR